MSGILGGVMTEPPGVPAHSRFPCLDGYRAIASLMVVCTHIAFHTALVVRGAPGAMFSRFDFGVTLFFCISGFLLYRPWARSAIRGSARPRVKPYFIRRFARILPAYLVVVVAVILLVPGIWEASQAVGAAKVWITHLTLTQVYVPGAQIRGLTQMWSLATEISFYLALPVIGWIASRRKARTGEASVRWQFRLLLVLFAIGFAATLLRAILGVAAPQFSGFWLPAFLDWFSVGMLFALLHEARAAGVPLRLGSWVNRLAADPMIPVGLGVAVLVIAMTPLAGPYTLAPATPLSVGARHYLYLVAAALLLIPAIAGDQRQGRWREFLQTPLMVFLGEISYGIFLWHLFVLELVYWALGLQIFSGPPLILFPSVLLGSIVMGWLSWVAVERPSIAWSHRRTARSKQPAPPPQPATAPS